MRIFQALLLCAFLGFVPVVYGGEPLSIYRTIAEVAETKKIDPYILLSIALMESKVKIAGEKGRITIWPWALRIGSRSVYPSNITDAKAVLTKTLQGTPLLAIDVGMFQINLYHFNALRLKYPRFKNITYIQLLDPRINTQVAASFLFDAIHSTNNKTLSIGRYHSYHTDKATAYGQKSVAIAEKLRLLNIFSEDTKGGMYARKK